MQAEMATKAATAPPNTDHRGKKIYDLKSKEAREIMAKQKVQGYTPDFSYVERVGYLDLYIPVPEVLVSCLSACMSLRSLQRLNSLFGKADALFGGFSRGADDMLAANALFQRRE